MNPFLTLWRWVRRRPAARQEQEKRKSQPLREFVYLDEVSLRSLLSSQTGEIKDAVSELSQSELLGELSLKLAGKVPFAAKAEAASRFQTSNSSTLQTSRKATVQSWFRDLHERSDLRLISPIEGVEPIEDVSLLPGLAASIAASAPTLSRGALVEFRVRLSAHPVFHLTTMMTEFTGMTEDYADMLPDASLTNFHQIQPMVKVLQRLMAGLIPISAEAIDYVVIDHDKLEYIVHRDAAAGLGLEARPLMIMGVTDHEAYWKDIRRVLFSGATFTMLCRIARPGIHRDWTPVKLVDVFGEMAPDFARQISVAWRTPFGGVQTALTAEPLPSENGLGAALKLYGQGLLSSRRAKLSSVQLTEVDRIVTEAIGRLQTRTASVSDQKSAFVALRHLLSEIAQVRISPAKDMELRSEARAIAGLSFFPGQVATTTPVPSVTAIVEEDKALLDVEVVAIYW